MKNFGYYMPVRAFFGKDCVKAHQDVLAQFGKKALIVTGRHSAKANGAQADITSALEAVGCSWVLFDQVGENPDLETVVAAGKMAQEEKVDFVIGIGGGSPMDAAKAISVLAANPGQPSDILFTDPKAKALPVVEIPTTAGTGSEVTQYAIITIHERRTKNGIVQPLFASASFLDPKYMDALSAKVTNNTAVDAMSHLVESYLNTAASTLSKKMALAGLSYWKECIPALKARAYTPEIREKLMMASAIGGMVIAQTSTSIPHGLGYFLTYEKGIPHGRANGMLMQAYLELFDKDDENVKAVLDSLGLASTEEMGQLMKDVLDIPETFTAEDLAYYTKRALETPQKLLTFPCYGLGEKEVLSVYEKSLL